MFGSPRVGLRSERSAAGVYRQIPWNEVQSQSTAQELSVAASRAFRRRWNRCPDLRLYQRESARFAVHGHLL